MCSPRQPHCSRPARCYTQELSTHTCLPCYRPKPQLASQISSFLSAHVRRRVTGCHPVVQQLLQLEAQARVAAQLAQAGFQARRRAQLIPILWIPQPLLMTLIALLVLSCTCSLHMPTLCKLNVTNVAMLRLPAAS